MPTIMSTYGARLRISSWSFWAMQPSTPMTASGLRRLSMPHAAEGGVGLVLGVFANRTGVEEEHVGVGGRVGEVVALLAERADDELAVEHVHLAADGFDVDSLRHGRVTVMRRGRPDWVSR